MESQPVSTPTKETAMDISRDNRAFVVRGNQMFLHKEEKGTPAYIVKDKGAKEFSPRKVALQDQSRRMLLLSPLKKNTIQYTDTETGKALHQLSLKLTDDMDSPIQTFASPTKFSGLKPADIVQLKVASLNRVVDLEWDPRTKQDEIIINEDASSIIKGKGLSFRSVATTKNGGIAAVSNDGVVRLYNELGKKAKTQLDQYSGVDASAIDVSSDGQWVLWTAPKFLALSNVAFKNEKGEDVTGFEKPLGKNKGNTLIIKLLEKELTDMGITEDDVNFAAARFDNGPSIDDTGLVLERYIVTSTGPFTIQWNMRTLEQDYKQLDKSDVNYAKARPKIVKQNDTILAQLFDYDVSNYGVVTALSQDLKRMKVGN